MSAGTTPVVKKVSRLLDENQNESRAQIRPSPDYMPTERTSSASYKPPSTGIKKSKPAEPEITTFSSALDYIRSPVRYLTSVFIQPPTDLQKSPPKPRQKHAKMAAGLDKKSPNLAEMLQIAEAQSAPVATADRPPEALADALNTDLFEPGMEKKFEFVQNATGKEKKPVTVTDHKKGSDAKRSTSQLWKAPVKPQVKFSTRNYREQKRHSPSPAVRLPPMSPRILSASSIQYASLNNRSYRVTSIEKEDASAKSKKPAKKVFKIDRERSPVNSVKVQSSPVAAEKREDVAHGYVPLNAIEISRF
ncbi:hypothetical protein BsWGS_13945 [Bradybaena similaris]